MTASLSWECGTRVELLLSGNPADNVAVESKHTEIYIVCQVQEESKTQGKINLTPIKKKKMQEEELDFFFF